MGQFRSGLALPNLHRTCYAALRKPITQALCVPCMIRETFFCLLFCIPFHGSASSYKLLVEYPEKTKVECIEGQVTIGFMVSETGRYFDYQVLSSSHKLLNEHSLMSLQQYHKAIPFLHKMQLEYPVTSSHVVTFKLSDSERREYC